MGTILAQGQRICYDPHMLLPQVEFTLPFFKKEQLTHNVYSFYFDRSANKDFSFEAGQYMRVLLEFDAPDPKRKITTAFDSFFP